MVYSFTTCSLIGFSQIDTLSDVVRERDKTMFEMQRTIDDQDTELGQLSRAVRDLVGEVRDLHRGRPVEIIDLMADDDEGVVVGENEVPLMVWTVVWMERDETTIPESPQGTLVEIRDDPRSTPQIVGEAERVFERIVREGSVVQRAWDEKADYVTREGAAPEYLGPPPYEHINFFQ